MTIRDLERCLMKKRPKLSTSIPARDFASSGITELNLAISGDPLRGVAKSVYYLMIGDSSSGKGVIAMTIAAEIANNPKFDEYNIVYDPVEDGVLMNLRRMYGKKLASRIRTVNDSSWEERKHSETVSDFYDNANNALDKGPCLYILDSMDALQTKEEKKLNQENRSRRSKGLTEKESFALSKPKENSAKLRQLVRRLTENGSILIIISQTRHNIGFGAQFNPKTRAGGDALKFYCRVEFWLSIKQKIKEKVGNKSITKGQITKIKITKNHISGFEGDIEVPIYRKVGIDDCGAMIDFLIEYGHWKINKGKINASEFDVVKNREDLCHYVESRDLYTNLQKLVAKYWHEIEDKITVKRRSRYE